LVSRNENLVDKSSDPKSLFWKLDFINDHLPKWMVPNHTRTKLHLLNEDNKSTIDGESTTGSVGRGDRRTAVMMDEFAAFDHEDGYRALAATQQVTRTRFFNSTPAGVNNAHYDMIQLARSTDSDVELMRFHWSNHPVQSAGLYSSTQGQLQVIDEGYKFPKNYPYE
jgi:hypothetical protein